MRFLKFLDFRSPCNSSKISLSAWEGRFEVEIVKVEVSVESLHNEFFWSRNVPSWTRSPSGLKNCAVEASCDCCTINRNLISDDLPALLRPINTVIGRKRSSTFVSKTRKFSISSFVNTFVG